MRVENKTLYIEEEILDEDIEEFLATISQDDIEKIVVLTAGLGASIIQALLIKKQDKEIVLEDEVLKKIFENVIYKNI